MRDLLYKELKLCLHPMNFVFMAFALMLLIPNYIYTIPCFFVCNAIFYSFQMSVQNNDALFTLLLPVGKREAVRSKYRFVTILELAMLVLYVPMIFLNHAILGNPNTFLDACPTLIGASFITFAVFNAVFMPTFYKTGVKAGRSFLLSAIAVFVWIFASEGFFMICRIEQAPYFMKWAAEHLDVFPSSGYDIGVQLITIAVCAAVFAAVTLVSERASIRNFEKVDL